MVKFVGTGSCGLACSLFLIAIGLSATLACSRHDAEPKKAAVTSVVSAVTAGGPDCTAAGDPFADVGGTSTCTGNVAQATFQRAICACHAMHVSAPLVIDGFDATKGPPDGGNGADVATNQSQAWSASVQVSGDLVTPGNLTTSASTTVGGDLELGGTLTTSAPFTVAGNAAVVRPLPSQAVVEGTVTEVASVEEPCDCQDVLPIASIVAAHRPPANDDASIGLSPNAAMGASPASIDLPCGNYYLSQINTSGPLTIAVHGHTALYIDGNINASGALHFQLDATATLDLFVAGSINASSEVVLGSTTSPAHCRAYVAGTSVNRTSLAGRSICSISHFVAPFLAA